MSEYDWHPVLPLRWSVTGNLQQQFKRRVSNSRGIWYDEYEWRDVPRQPVDDIPLIKYPAQETPPAPDCIGCEIARQELERMKVARQCGTCGKIHRALQL